MREMGETPVQVSFCDGGNLNGSIDESVEFVRLRVRSVSMTRQYACETALCNEARSTGGYEDCARLSNLSPTRSTRGRLLPAKPWVAPILVGLLLGQPDACLWLSVAARAPSPPFLDTHYKIEWRQPMRHPLPLLYRRIKCQGNVE